MSQDSHTNTEHPHNGLVNSQVDRAIREEIGLRTDGAAFP